MPLNAEIFVLRHATLDEESELPNLKRPLTKLGHRQAEALVSYLSSLNIDAVYTSPYRRAKDTVQPFCEHAGITAKVRKDLGESAEDEDLAKVKTRMIKIINGIARKHPGGRALVCTHGGCLWGLITYFDESFGPENYKKIKSPEMRRIVYTDGTPKLMDQLTF